MKRLAVRRAASVVGVVALGLAGLTACGGSNDSGSSSPSSPGTSTSQAAAGTNLATADVGGFGKVVVDGNGRTVYVFDKDTSGKSNCEGGCLAMWPAVPAGDGTPQLDGIDASLVSTVTRSDGTKQLAIGGLPIYLFANDSQAGDAKGQAVGGTWWVVGADGKKITAQPSAGDNGNGNGY
ncbi:COG4315 family predicted lipoprotein [Kribbella sp. NPDC055071]